MASTLDNTRRCGLLVAGILVLLAACGEDSINGGDELSAEEFWVCAAAPGRDSTYEAIVGIAMVERADNRGRDLRSIVRSVRVDRQPGAVETRIDAGTAVERDGFERDLLATEAVAGLHRTSNGPFGGCGSPLSGSSLPA